MSTDARLREMLAGLPAPELVASATLAPALTEATVAVVTTAGLRPARDITLWPVGDGSFVVLPDRTEGLTLTHFSPNFDRSGFAVDPNVVFPVDRLHDLAAGGEIGAVASTHLSFMGAQFDFATIIQDTGPAAARMLIEAGVDVVLLTPV